MRATGVMDGKVLNRPGGCLCGLGKPGVYCVHSTRAPCCCIAKSWNSFPKLSAENTHGRSTSQLHLPSSFFDRRSERAGRQRAGALAYITLLPAILFLVLTDYNKVVYPVPRVPVHWAVYRVVCDSHS